MKNIENRVSVRTFDKKEISKDHMEKLVDFISNIEKGYPDYRLPLINSNVDGKVGTYGVITGGNTYICGIVKKDNPDLVELGYLFEKIILFATSLGLGTCWLGGTFNRSEFAEKVGLASDESFICATPVGYVAEKKSIKERAMRKMAKSDHRKDFSEIFFDPNLDPLNKDSLGVYGKALEMVRIGPSASNKQPWRIVKQEKSYHLFLERTPNYAKDLAYDIQLLDMGIAKYHFEASLKESGEDGYWGKVDRHPEYENLEYISTWLKEI